MPLISDSDAVEFCRSRPSEEQVRGLDRHELRLVAQCLELDCPSTCTREGLVNLVVLHLGLDKHQHDNVKSDVLSDSAASLLSRDTGAQTIPPQNPATNDLQLKLKLELAKIQLQLAQVEAGNESVRLERTKLEVAHTQQGAPNVFDVSKHIKLVPPFSEQDVDTYFRSFEKIADSLSWPKSYWPILLQSVLIGKAQRTFVALSRTQCADYDIVKAEILKAYQLVPEAYRRKFREGQKRPEQTYVEFSSVKREAFEQWLRSQGVTDFSGLCELILLEEFQTCVSREVSIFLHERNVSTLQDAAVLADNYVLLHRDSPVNHFGFERERRNNYLDSRKPAASFGGPITSNQIKAKGVASEFNKETIPRSCNYCGKLGHQTKSCWKRSRDISGVKSVFVATPNDEGRFTETTRGESVGNEEQPVTLPCLVSNGASCNETSSSPISQSLKLSSESKVNISTEAGVGTYEPFLSSGTIMGDWGKREIQILRDSGALQTLLLEGVVPTKETGKRVMIRSLWGVCSVPLVETYLWSSLYVGPALVGVVKTLPVPGVQLLLGNDLAGGRVIPTPILSEHPEKSVSTQQLEESCPGLFPVCAVTRSMTSRCVSPTSTVDAARENDNEAPDEVKLELEELFNLEQEPNTEVSVTTDTGGGREALVAAQRADGELQRLREDLEDEQCTKSDYYLDRDVLMRRWAPRTVPEEDVSWSTVHQVIVPNCYRKDIISVAHDNNFAGHLGRRKTLDRIWRHFYWPGIRRDVAEYCRSCHTCQLVGKPNASIQPAPLIPIPAFEEPFTKVLVDIVGPLPKTSAGYSYILTVMDMSTRYPEAMPLRNTHAKTVVKELLKFFSKFGLPKEIQTDQGSNFTSHSFHQSLNEMGINHITSSAYHPQSQGALERYHQTLKSMLRKYCMENEKDWDQGIPYVLFATREVPNESLGFSPFELVFCHEVRGPLKVVKERWLSNENSSGLLKTVTDLKDKLRRAWEVAGENLTFSQRKMKTWYDQRARERVFQEGDQVLVLLPVQGKPLHAKYSGPYKVIKRVGDVNYLISTPDRRKHQRLCHINMLKLYHQRESGPEIPTASVCVASPSLVGDEAVNWLPVSEDSTWMDNSVSWEAMIGKLEHLSSEQRQELATLLSQHQDLFRTTPGRTSIIQHDVDVGEANPIKQSPYRVNPNRAEIIKKELEYMLRWGLVEVGSSDWSSPVTLVPKPDGSHRFCIDYRKLNAVTRKDSYPLPRVETCIDEVGRAKFITKIDMLKGYWQIPLTARARQVSCFTTLGRTYLCNVLPFGMTNAPATYQRLMNSLTADIPGCVVYIDDVVIYSDTWDEHMKRLKALLTSLSSANLVVKLAKCEFVQATVQYLGYIIGQGVVAPPTAKIKGINDLPVPTCKKELRRFIGMVGYYRMFINNFAGLLSSLTDLLKKGVKFEWTPRCNEAFTQLKGVLCCQPVLQAPDFCKPFKLACDASDVGAGAVLLQENNDGVHHPVSYFSKKFNPAQRNYSVIEKELLSLILALQHFEVYLCSGDLITVYTDHHPLKFLSKFKHKNQRLTRWSLFLQEYNLDVKHIRGPDNVLADCLSRI